MPKSYRVWYMPYTSNGKTEYVEKDLDELKKMTGIENDFALFTYLSMNKIGKSPKEFEHFLEMKKISEESKKHPLYYL